MEIQHEDDKFFVIVDGERCELIYNMYENKMDIYHIFTPPNLRGRGIAEKLAVAAFNHAKQNNMKVIPSCPYISETFLKKHREFNDMVKA